MFDFRAVALEQKSFWCWISNGVRISQSEGPNTSAGQTRLHRSHIGQWEGRMSQIWTRGPWPGSGLLLTLGIYEKQMMISQKWRTLIEMLKDSRALKLCPHQFSRIMISPWLSATLFFFWKKCKCFDESISMRNLRQGPPNRSLLLGCVGILRKTWEVTSPSPNFASLGDREEF